MCPRPFASGIGSTASWDIAAASSGRVPAEPSGGAAEAATPATNIEQIVTWLLHLNELGGFHFNDRKFADDDLTLGSIDPYQLFRIFHEIALFESGNQYFLLTQDSPGRLNVQPMPEALATEKWIS